jgi:hypothetical protein
MHVSTSRVQVTFVVMCCVLKQIYFRLERVLTMTCIIQNYWAPGLCPSSSILETREHNVSETGCVSVLR